MDFRAVPYCKYRTQDQGNWFCLSKMRFEGFRHFFFFGASSESLCTLGDFSAVSKAESPHYLMFERLENGLLITGRDIGIAPEFRRIRKLFALCRVATRTGWTELARGVTVFPGSSPGLSRDFVVTDQPAHRDQADP